ncbi:MAG: hypothetical protein ABI333_09815 [bacterium]
MRPTLRSLAGLCTLLLLASLTPLLFLFGCTGGSGGGGKSKAYGPVLSLLLPAGKKNATCRIERRRTRFGQTLIMLPRELQVTRTDTGVIDRFRERINPKEWRLAAQLFIDARPDGAWLRAQYSLVGKRVGAKGPRLLFPWPPKPGSSREVVYRILDGRLATGTVTVTRYGFSQTVKGTEYKPCLEVQEALRFKKGGGVALRSVYCTGFGRVEIETNSESPQKEKTKLVDRTLECR